MTCGDHGGSASRSGPPAGPAAGHSPAAWSADHPLAVRSAAGPMGSPGDRSSLVPWTGPADTSRALSADRRTADGEVTGPLASASGPLVTRPGSPGTATGGHGWLVDTPSAP